MIIYLLRQVCISFDLAHELISSQLVQAISKFSSFQLGERLFLNETLYN